MTTRRDVYEFNSFAFPQAAVALVEGDIVGFNTAGFIVLATAAASVIAIGIAAETSDNSGGAAGDVKIAVKLSQTVYAYPIENNGGDACDDSSVGHDVYAGAANTARKTSNSGAAARLGKCYGFTKDLKVLVAFDADPDSADIAALDDRVTAAEASILALETTAAPSMQAGNATLATGTIVVNTGIIVQADSEVIPIVIGDITGSTNFGTLRERKSARVNGIAGFGSITIDAVGNDGLLDADAAGAIRYVIFTPPA